MASSRRVDVPSHASSEAHSLSPQSQGRFPARASLFLSSANHELQQPSDAIEGVLQGSLQYSHPASDEIAQSQESSEPRIQITSLLSARQADCPPTVYSSTRAAAATGSRPGRRLFQSAQDFTSPIRPSFVVSFFRVHASFSLSKHIYIAEFCGRRSRCREPYDEHRLELPALTRPSESSKLGF
jgi:hypothetical protein